MKESINVYKVKLVKESTEDKYETQITNPRDAATIVQDYIGNASKEHFIVLALSMKNDIAGIHTVSTGSLSNSIVHPREVFKFAILNNSAGVILAHNHPSGSTTPSKEDCKITKRLKEAGELLGVEVIDHLIVGFDTDKIYSFKEHGKL